MTNTGPNLPIRGQAMAAAARHLAAADHDVVDGVTTIEERARLAEAWIAFAKELADHQHSGLPRFQ